MFQVFQDNKPCASYKISAWDVDTFKTRREAELFAAYWAYPIGLDQREEFARPMKLNTPINMSMSGFPVMMEIREV